MGSRKWISRIKVGLFDFFLNLGPKPKFRGYVDPQTGEFIRVYKKMSVYRNGRIKKVKNPEYSAYYVHTYRDGPRGPVRISS